MDKCGIDFLRLFKVAAGALLTVAACYFLASAEDYAHHGAISVTFHQENEYRGTPETFYVTREEGLTRWRNYKEKDPYELQKEKTSVYEIKYVPIHAERTQVPDREQASANTQPQPNQ